MQPLWKHEYKDEGILIGILVGVCLGLSVVLY